MVHVSLKSEMSEEDIDTSGNVELTMSGESAKGQTNLENWNEERKKLEEMLEEERAKRKLVEGELTAERLNVTVMSRCMKDYQVRIDKLEAENKKLIESSEVF